MFGIAGEGGRYNRGQRNGSITQVQCGIHNCLCRADRGGCSGNFACDVLHEAVGERKYYSPFGVYAAHRFFYDEPLIALLNVNVVNTAATADVCSRNFGNRKVALRKASGAKEGVKSEHNQTLCLLLEGGLLCVGAPRYEQGQRQQTNSQNLPGRRVRLHV